MNEPELRRTRFEFLFREHHAAVRAYARRRAPGEAVDDIVSDTFLVVWRRLEEVPDPALPWLLSVARNVVGTEWRGTDRRQRLWLKAQSQHAEGYDFSDPAMTDRRVSRALARLKERDREALTLVAWDGLTPTQAAAVLGEPPARFRQRLHRARSRLRDELSNEPNPETSAPAPIDHTPSGDLA
jgi:RNA polymerase sigma factor (sigma-70 family)